MIEKRIASLENKLAPAGTQRIAAYVVHDDGRVTPFREDYPTFTSAEAAETHFLDAGYDQVIEVKFVDSTHPLATDS